MLLVLNFGYIYGSDALSESKVKISKSISTLVCNEITTSGLNDW